MTLITCLGQEPIYTRLAELLDLQDIVCIFYRLCKNTRLQKIVETKLVWKTWARAHRTILQYTFLLAVRGSKNFILMKTCIECGACAWGMDTRVVVRPPHHSVYNMFAPVFFAVKKGCLETLRLLCDNGASIKAPELLIWAFIGKNYDIVEYLWNNGTSRDQVTTTVAEYNDLEAMKFLLDQNADINGQTFDMWTPLMAAASRGHYHMVKLLIDRGADIFVRCINNDTALDAALRNIDIDSCSEKIICYLATIQLLLYRNARHAQCFYWKMGRIKKNLADPEIQEAIKRFCTLDARRLPISENAKRSLSMGIATRFPRKVLRVPRASNVQK